MKTVIEPSVIDGIMQELEISDVKKASIRQIGAVVREAEKRTDQPLGSSDEKGSPEPPPVLSPMRMACGIAFILLAKSLAELKACRLVSTATCFCHLTLAVAGST